MYEMCRKMFAAGMQKFSLLSERETLINDSCRIAQAAPLVVVGGRNGGQRAKKVSTGETAERAAVKIRRM